jgi:small-conductance mechanosensitive channel
MADQKPKPRKERAKKLTSKTKSIFQEWWEYSTFAEDDTFGRKLYKVFVRIVGIITIIIFSPAIAVVLLVAFLAVM